VSQFRKWFTDEQIKVLLQRYCQGLINRADLQEMMEVGKSCYFMLLKVYRSNPDRFQWSSTGTWTICYPGYSEQSHAAALHQASIHQSYRKLPGDRQKFDRHSCPG
jgi:hypothetical protein